MSQIFKPTNGGQPVANSITGTAPIQANGVSGVAQTGNVTISVTDATAGTSGTASLGVASFNSLDFTVTNGFVSLTNPTAFAYTNVTHAMSPYTVLTTDYYLSVDTSGGVVTLKFPNAPTTYQEWIVKDRLGDASISNISVTTVGGAVTIDGETTYELAGNYSSIQLLFNSTSYEVF